MFANTLPMKKGKIDASQVRVRAAVSFNEFAEVLFLHNHDFENALHHHGFEMRFTP